ncbi:hypothetical protein [Campylobacter ureolyticus]|uniref:pyridoxamine 5'-phosphate oxidase family protein n=1 Tax=Campylobacter ureolyticus TaxID=827 RepID=UPI002F962AD5
MRRIDRKLSDESAYKIVDNCEYATFSTMDENEVFSIPLSIARSGNFIYIHGALDGSKKGFFGTAKRLQ